MKEPFNVKLLVWICNAALVITTFLMVVLVYFSFAMLNNLPESGDVKSGSDINISFNYNLAGNEFIYRYEKPDSSEAGKAVYYYAPAGEPIEFDIEKAPRVMMEFGGPLEDSLAAMFKGEGKLFDGMDVSIRTSEEMPIISGKPAIPLNKALFVEFVERQRWIYPIALIYVIIMIWLFRKFVVGLRQPGFFTHQNVRYLNWTSLMIIAAPFLEILIKWLMVDSPYKDITINGERIHGPNYDFDLTMLIAGLAVWVIAWAFRQGVELQQEQELTI